MSILLSIINYCVANGLLSGDGVDAFRDFMPESPDTCVVLHEYAGEAPTPYDTIANRSVQVKVRGATADVARAKAVAICSLLNPSAESRRVNLDANTWCQIYIRQTPFKLGQDESDRVTYCFNIGITTNNLE